MIRATALAFGIALAALGLLAVPASAHAGLIAADPGAGLLDHGPAVVHLRFSEAVTPVGRGIAVWAPSGRLAGSALSRPAPTELQVVVDGTERGTYLVVWQVIAADTHPSRGSYTFSVGVAGPVPEAGGLPAGDIGAVSPLGLLLQVVGRWLHMAGFALGFGSLAFALLVLGPDAPPAAETACRRLALAGVALLVASEPLMLVAQVISLGGLDGQVFADVLASGFGRIVALRTGAGLLLWALLGAAAQSSRSRAGWAILALGAVLAFVDAAASHAVVGVPELFGLLLNALHEAAMGLWLGGLAALVAVLVVVGPEARAGLVGRFGRRAAVAGAILLLSGALLALSHLRSPSDILSSNYAAVVAIKVVGVAAALLLAVFGLRVGRSWRAEAVALGGVLALAGLLVSLPPPR